MAKHKFKIHFAQVQEFLKRPLYQPSWCKSKETPKNRNLQFRASNLRNPSLRNLPRLLKRKARRQCQTTEGTHPETAPLATRPLATRRLLGGGDHGRDRLFEAKRNWSRDFSFRIVSVRRSFLVSSMVFVH